MPAFCAPPTSLYIHVPWCMKKCPYCDFNSHQSKKEIDEKKYVDALMRDLDYELTLTGPRQIKSIFFGGGTPSLFTPESISNILEGAKNRLDIENNIEITLEANPGTFEQHKFSEFRSAGINRLSIGIQSFDNDLLDNIGRVHDGSQAKTAIDTALKAGFENINTDLMFGLPGQSCEQATNDVKIACEYGLQHLSHYQLTIEPNTFFYKYPPRLPETDLVWEMQNQCHEILLENGFSQYEVSAFSRANKQCLHNINYWLFGDYIGIGAGAHGKISEYSSDSAAFKISRRWKKRQPEEYMDKTATVFESGELASTSVIENNKITFEFLLNALRLKDGTTYDCFERHTNIDRQQLIESCQVIDKELLEIGSEGVKTTQKGYNFLNNVLEKLL